MLHNIYTSCKTGHYLVHHVFNRKIIGKYVTVYGCRTPPPQAAPVKIIFIKCTKSKHILRVE